MTESIIFSEEQTVEGQKINLTLTLRAQDSIEGAKLVYNLTREGKTEEFIVDLDKQSNSIKPRAFDIGVKELTCLGWCAASFGASFTDCISKSSNIQEFINCLREQKASLSIAIINCIYQCSQ